MCIFCTKRTQFGRRTSHEVRGLKLSVVLPPVPSSVSHLTRGAWIEIALLRHSLVSCSGRTSHEVRGLKYNYPSEEVGLSLVAPHTRCVD